MIAYRLDDLGWFEFEQLIQALLKVRLGLGVEAWGGRGDWGRDAYFNGKLRYPSNDETTGKFVFQSKFIENANAAGAKSDNLLLSALQKESVKIGANIKNAKWRDVPICYSLFTNARCSAPLRESVYLLLREVLPNSQVTIHDGNDICQWLRLSSEIVRSFPQLLSLRDLQDLLNETVHSDVIVRSQAAIALAQAQSLVFVPTEAYDLARSKLAKYSFVVLEGPPEMGKTTTGRIIALSQVVCGWEAIECRSATDILKMRRQDRRQVFVADDFFGRTEYDPMRVTEWQSELAHILPFLDHSHWLILTCRAHLLEMAKANLDIAGQNNRFPELGEVIVNAGKLRRSEKGRMLYRHAKNHGLGEEEKRIVKKHCVMIVDHNHFTPERIRRLIEDLVPKLALQNDLNEDEMEKCLSEAITNPTKQMRVSFRNLPSRHRWMMFALLEAEQSRRHVGTSLLELQRYYEKLCPPNACHPFRFVIEELTEAFVKRTEGVFGGNIDWIHPSCRDLAIDELQDNAQDRQQFLKSCSESGLALASSLAGGASGERLMPLLQTDDDWQHFGKRVEELVCVRLKIVNVIWVNFKALKEFAEPSLKLDDDLRRFAEVIRNHLCPTALRKLERLGYAEATSLRTYFEICREFNIRSEIDLSEAWSDCIEEAESWSDGNGVIWQDDGLPRRVNKFVSVLIEFASSTIETPEILEHLNTIHNAILERVRSEEGISYSSPKDNDEAAERASAYESLHEDLEKLATIPVWTKKQNESLKEWADHFQREADSLTEDLPVEPDYDRESLKSTDAGDLNLNELFSDL